ncbi:hypothetical protein [Neobacillus sp. LXY-4]|uniref:hypothetical protein n=1 Tax=Neobacillus sp. LXY-4 TaxID=3379826 RepID=UPI003EDF5569
MERRNINQRIYRACQSVEELEVQVKKIKRFIDSSMDTYSRTEDKIVQEAEIIHSKKKRITLKLNEILGYFDTINKAMSWGDIGLVGSLTMSAFGTAISTSRLRVNYIDGKPSLLQKVKGGYKFTIQADPSWTSRGRYSNKIAKILYDFSKSSPTNLITRKIHNVVSSYTSPSAILKHAAGFPKNVNGVMKAATLSERIHIRATFGSKEAAQALANMKGWTGVGKRIPMVGTAISIGANLTEYVDPKNEGKSVAEKTGRFIAGIVTDAASIAVGVKVGATIGSFGGPVGIIVGGAVGGLVGGVASTVVGDQIKDVGESIVSVSENGITKLANGLKSVEGWFR